MTTEKVHLTGAKETMLLTLYSRALHSRGPAPLLRDPWAEQAVERIDYDFASLRLPGRWPVGAAIRARQFDAFARDWIAERPQSTVLHLGCGLDSRAYRVDPPATVRWFDVDHPEVIELRRQVYPDRQGCETIGTSLVEPGWLERVPADLPVLVLAEGVTMYLPTDGAEALFAGISARFPGGRLAFDALSRVAVRLSAVDRAVAATGATLSWGLDDPGDLRRSVPTAELLAEITTPRTPGHERLPIGIRAAAAFMEPFPRLRRMNRILLYSF